jgi:hypothetical protein
MSQLPLRTVRLIGRPDSYYERYVGQAGEIYYDNTNQTLRIYPGNISEGKLLADRTWVNSAIVAAGAGSGDVLSAGGGYVDNRIVRYDGVTGTIIQVSSASISDAGLLTATSFSGIGTLITALNATELTSGTVPIGRIGATGTASASTYLRGDNSWATVSGGISADPEYNNGAIIDLVGDGSNFFSREVTTNGVRIVAAGAVGGQTAVPDAFVEKVARMFELFTDVNGAGINEASQRTFIKTLSGDAGTYHAAVGPTLQRVARGAGSDYTPNFLTDEGIASYNLSPLFDSHVANDMVWYLNSTGAAPGDGDNDAQEVIEHVFHTLHMHGLDAVSLKMYSYITADWASGPLYAAMEEAYDAGKWDSSGYGGNAWKTDGDAFEVAAKEYLFLLNFGMFEYSSLWDGGSLSPEWTDDMRTQSGIQANNPLGYALHNSYIATVISKPSLTTIRSIFQDGDVGDPTVAGASGYVVDVVSSEGNLVVSELTFPDATVQTTAWNGVGDLTGSVFSDDSSIMVDAVGRTLAADLLTLTPVATVPLDPQQGQLAVADGAGWDPSGSNPTKKQTVIYLGSAWVQIAVEA